ncbi:monocarboxylate transporter 4 [Electrophorus electricus]|uniref:Major facilitator superfamily (MFS) profile domain-containing protein n=1 Tax=Electrophorus electricus TaxID=8005 RepID=A0A4W4F1X2_ELEEL|nr:monocarboxylate transporter 4 [Electrophorus electricus]XP_035389385.1 monocarboxylate transporter 4 [Electrophorus electricus]XP_035389386.1 monocarboxylate transporter 4 [Electrophorus electricus]XP_035389387.1 monocarboxylate transporter 4 [Electrophorus electricus]XP_035389388.1 monocarboxylate transporter 4 [Electrophorus electricus]
MGGVALDDGPSGVKAPDGGWGWAVLFGCFVITGFSYAFPKAVSVFFKELIREFGVGYSDTAWISSILLAMLYGSGPLCSVLVNRFGCRPVMMVGGLFASAGMILASFATNIIHIYLSTGVITGLGLALNFQPSLIMLNRYFSEKRPLANGLAAAGSPVALCCLSPLGQALQYLYGWRGGFLILGGMLLNCCVCGALMRPLMAPKKTEEDQEAPKTEDEKPKRKLLDFSVFKDRGFLIYTIAAAIMVLGLFVPPVFVVSYAKELGNEDTKSALLLTILGFIDIFARPTCGVIAGLKWVRPRCVYFFSFAMIFNGTTDLIGSMSKDYASLVVFCIFFGISYGMVGALQFEVLMEIVGTEKFSSAIGLVLLVEAVAVLVGPPGAGRLLDATKVYMYVFLLAGCEVVLSALVLCICNIIFIRKPQKPDPSAKMEMAVTEAEMEQLNSVPRDEHQDGDEGQPENMEVGEQSVKQTRGKQVEEPQKSTGEPDKAESSKDEEGAKDPAQKDSKEATKTNGCVVEPESSL